MAQNVVINGVVYADVPEVDIPKQGGGTTKFFDTAGGDFTGADLLTGKTGYGPSGAVPGTMPNNGDVSGTIGTKAGTVAIPSGYTSGGTVSLTNVADCLPQNILAGKSILGQNGTLALPSISQDSTTKILSIA